MGQQEIIKFIEKENITTINELMENLGLGKRSLQQSLARMVANTEICVIIIKNKRFYVNNELCIN